MTTNEFSATKSFEPISVLNESFIDTHAEAAADTILRLSQAAIEFAGIERKPRYDSESRENDAEHSFMLSLVSIELAHQYYPDLDKGLIAQFTAVHDLVELETGDIPTFSISEAELAAKEAVEHEALHRVCARLAPGIGKLLVQYESQSDPEARFVRFLDKLLPLAVDIQGAGSKIMHEDYDTHTTEDLIAIEQQLADRCRQRFPESDLQFIHAIRAVLSERFVQSYDSQCHNC